MKTNNKPAGPNLDSIISGLGIGSKKPETPQTETKESQQENSSNQEEKEENDETSHEGRLWKEFLDILNDPEETQEDNRTTKLYAIDDDIVETLHQCDFDGMPNVDVINSILRAFLIDNIERLRQMQRQRSISLLDKY